MPDNMKAETEEVASSPRPSNHSVPTMPSQNGKLTYLSPIACPLLEGKALRRSLKLIQLAADRERAARGAASAAREGSKGEPENGKVKKKSSSYPKLLRRGVQEVTKCLRKGTKGVVLFASDVFPIEIIAHLPILCEEKDVVYAYLCSKKTLGHAFRSRRPASVVMVTPSEDGEGQRESQQETKATEEGGEEKFEDVYKKVHKMIRKSHPYF
ncbi:60s ribosomal protein l7a [Cystoisospora suis]|uniref:60s ribosomal protein l7a n=1 Tax=Cystoisospora suis TaxID=483139 RepID=A0A2C6KIT9_9APIC|nr:60s ribosomal protein l7a [Cystoisospora suis]